MKNKDKIRRKKFISSGRAGRPRTKPIIPNMAPADPYDNPLNLLLISCNKPDCRVNNREYLTVCGDCTSKARKLFKEGFWLTYDRKPPRPAPSGWRGERDDKHWIPVISPLFYKQIDDYNFELSEFDEQERLWNGEGD